jgi:acyl-CoA thioesterase-2
MFDLVAHGPDTYVGTGPQYPWGGLYGGQIVAQALRAATLSVEPEFVPHSIRAYFIRRGDHREPVRYEVDRIRNGRSFVTRRVVARQAVGAILNAECSFQRPEGARVLQTVRMTDVPGPEELPAVASFTYQFERRDVPPAAFVGGHRDGAGRIGAWVRALDDLSVDAEVLSQCWLAYISDDLPTDTVVAALRAADPDLPADGTMTVSLDHTLWFHRPMRADRWHLYEMTCHAFAGTRGLALGDVFAADGTHVASFAQEVLVRFPEAAE